jgi:glycosyltransferase involved in cell wall biosynthesis
MPSHPAPSPLKGMNVLFIHQNFPAQFVHLAPALVAAGCTVKALTIGGRALAGVDVRPYALTDKPLLPASDVVSDIEVKLRRATACAQAMRQLQADGFQPQLIIAHPGWGESLFCKDIWPGAVLVAYGEFYYQAEGADHGFDPEFSTSTIDSRMRLRMRNTALLHAYQAADAILCPTAWQKQCLPLELQAKATVIFDGIDTRRVAPDANASIHLQRQGIRLAKGDEIITFVNRNLEPYRGFHTFMRALPAILARRPNARCVMVGGNGVSYGAMPNGFKNWREVMLAEVGSRLPMDRVHFVGKVDYAHYLRLLQVSACHVYLTYPFVLSWSCIEAMSAGCTVVGSRTAPVLDVLAHGQNSLLFDFFDTQALTTQVCDVLANPAAHAPLGSAARREAVRHFDLHTVCLPAQLQLLTQLL